jgi:transposase
MPTTYGKLTIQRGAVDAMAGKVPFMSVNEAASQVKRESNGVPSTTGTRTIKRWYKHSLEYLEVPEETEIRLGKDWKLKQTRKDYQWSTVHSAKLFSLLEETPVLYLSELSDLLYEWDNSVRHSIAGISGHLRSKGWTRRRVYEKACQQVEQQRTEYTRALKELVTDVEMLIMLDESNKDRVAAIRRMGWGLKGKRVNFKSPFNVDTRYTWLAVADCYGFVLEGCEVCLHTVEGKTESKPVDRARFVEYFRQYVKPLLGNWSRGEKHSVLSMDNCSVHMDQEILDMVHEMGAKIIFTPPYTPDVVPIENMFGQWKKYLQKYHLDFAAQWYVVHIQGGMSVTPIQGSRYLRHCIPELCDIIDNHPLLIVSDPEFQVALAAAVVAVVGAAQMRGGL